MIRGRAATQKFKSQADRLRVFRELKSWMTEFHECPSAAYVSATTGISLSAVHRHFAALKNAKGLPMPISSGRARQVASLMELNSGPWRAHSGGKYAADRMDLDVFAYFRAVGCV